ncbi:hypothetical protein C900_00663 [Fulvivirga imtechensis AK7]|uniref:Uncharacterized protein n=1 Tax=Fulvivirga imtechensis AK7 TaxID=1237149 RepID=L8JLC9_9BACT|nr:hypothetical protein C900_00663 [Fulvivirga imtechensis AK7]
MKDHRIPAVPGAGFQQVAVLTKPFALLAAGRNLDGQVVI